MKSPGVFVKFVSRCMHAQVAWDYQDISQCVTPRVYVCNGRRGVMLLGCRNIIHIWKQLFEDALLYANRDNIACERII